jgi:ABC-type sugar transport system permease subunit
VVPALALVALFNLLPSLLQLLLALTDWNSFRPEISFTGLDNFASLLEDGSLVRGVQVTLVFAGVVTLVQNGVALALALALETTNAINSLFRAVFFAPVLIAPIAVGFIFRGLLDGDGALNGALSTLSGVPVTYEWLGDIRLTIVVVALVHSWKWLGLTMLIYIAGLNAIPSAYREAARVEGAGWWRTLRSVTLPLLAPAITVNVVITLIGALSAFDVVLATTRGGPARSTEVLNMFIFSQYGSGYFGYATALSLVLFALVCVLALPLVAVLRRREVTL